MANDRIGEFWYVFIGLNVCLEQPDPLYQPAGQSAQALQEKWRVLPAHEQPGTPV